MSNSILRDMPLDNVQFDPRFRQIEVHKVPDNPNLSATKPTLINQMLQYIHKLNFSPTANRYYVSFQLPKPLIPEMGASDEEFENFDTYLI